MGKRSNKSRRRQSDPNFNEETSDEESGKILHITY